MTIQIDSVLPGTALSASPKFFGRIDLFAFYKADFVTVWVQNEKQKYQWEEFVRGAKERRELKRNKGVPSYRIVIP